MRPNILLAVGEDSAQPRRWYYELVVDHVDPFLTPDPTHLRVGWACNEGYHPRPSGGDGWGGNGVGDDLCSYGFDGLHLWSGEDETQIVAAYGPEIMYSHSNENSIRRMFWSLLAVCPLRLRWSQSQLSLSSPAEERRRGQLLS